MDSPAESAIGVAGAARDRIRGVALASMDTSVQYQARARLAIANAVGARVGTTLDADRTAQELADVATESFADFVSVELLGPAAGDEPPDLRPPGAMLLRRAGQQSVLDGCPESVIAAGASGRYPADSPMARALVTGEAGLYSLGDPALGATGHDDTAYALLLQQECPSWLYALKHDATTVWERWDSMLPDGTVNPGDMTSFNHYALGAIAEWLHTTVVGLNAAEPGYREIVFRPRPGGGLTWAAAAHETPYGRAEIRWDLDETHLEVRTTVPTGTTARIQWPDGDETEVECGTTVTRRPNHEASSAR